MDLRPSRLGLLQIPDNPNQRGADKSEGKALDALNERLVKTGEYMHPTKGKRKMSTKRAAAARITADLENGYVSMSTKAIRDELKLAE